MVCIFVCNFLAAQEESGKKYDEAMLWLQFKLEESGYDQFSGNKVKSFKFDNDTFKIKISRDEKVFEYRTSIKNLDLEKILSVNEVFILKSHFKKSPFDVYYNNSHWTSFYCEIPLAEKDDLHKRVYNALRNAKEKYHSEFEVPSRNRF